MKAQRAKEPFETPGLVICAVALPEFILQCGAANTFQLQDTSVLIVSVKCDTNSRSEMAQQRDLPESLAWRAIGRLEAGQSQREVANAIGVAQSVISRLWTRFQTTGNVRRRPGQGRPRATTARDDRYLLLTTRRNRRQNATLLQRAFRTATGRTISTQTVRNRLREGGLYARRPMVCVPLTARHRVDRRLWAEEHRGWGRNEWGNVLFSDESRFSVEPDNRRVFIWRECGTRNNPMFVRERSQYHGGGLMVWAGISIGGRTELHIIRNGSLTALRYRDEILQPLVRLYAGAIGDSFLFMDDNARPHRARLVDEMLEAEGIARMKWPACSPDLNPIEHAWDMLGRRIAARPVPPTTIPELEVALLDEWHNIPQELIDNLIDSMPRRCEAVLAVRGDHTPY